MHAHVYFSVCVCVCVCVCIHTEGTANHRLPFRPDGSFRTEAKRHQDVEGQDGEEVQAVWLQLQRIGRHAGDVGEFRDHGNIWSAPGGLSLLKF